jgi:ribosomal protein L16 Arg81 hydroxylase
MTDRKAGATFTEQPPRQGRTTRVDYEKDVILWSEEQARLLRAGRFGELDIEHLADEIEDVGKSEKRELASRMAVLLAHLLKWRSQPENRTNSWRATIRDQRRRIAIAIRETPSLKAVTRDSLWQEGVWLDARAQALKETGLVAEDLPEGCPWTMDQAADPDFWPA